MIARKKCRGVIVVLAIYSAECMVPKRRKQIFALKSRVQDQEKLSHLILATSDV